MTDFNTALTHVASYVAGTPLFDTVAGVAWIIPALQTVHILSVAVVLGSASMVDLQVLGVIDRGRPLSSAFTRHLPPLAAAVVVLALTGVVLISGEPTRAPFRVVFWVKLALVLVGVLLTWSLPALARRRGVDESGAATADLKLIAVATLFVWAAVIVAGRWIGYANPWPGAPV